MGQLRKLLAVLILGMMLSLAACDSSNRTDPPTDFPELAAQRETNVPRAVEQTSIAEDPGNIVTPTGDSKNTTTPVVTAEPPVFADTLFAQSNYLAFGGDLTAGCEFPCWYGLRVGVSTGNDIQAFFDNILAFNGTRQFIPDDPPDSTLLPKEYYAAGYAWHSIEDLDKVDGVSSFVVNTFYNRETTILAGIEIVTSYSQLTRDLTPASIIKELGEPDQVYVALGGTERSDIARLSLDIIYSEGYLFRYPEIYIPYNGDSIQFCLGKPSWVEYDTSTIFMYLTEPFSGNPPMLTPLQEAMIIYLGSESFIDFSELFGIEVAEVTHQLMLQEDLCVNQEN